MYADINPFCVFTDVACPLITHATVAAAVKAVGIPTAEVHISRVEEREDFRQVSYIRAACCFTVTGHGTDGYLEAIDFLKEKLNGNNED